MADSEEHGLGTTRSELDHYFGNKVGAAKFYHNAIAAGLEPPQGGYDFDGCKRDFVEGLRRTVQEGLPVSGDITFDRLRAMAGRAEQLDWSSKAAIEELYRIYGELTGETVRPFE